MHWDKRKDTYNKNELSTLEFWCIRNTEYLNNLTEGKTIIYPADSPVGQTSCFKMQYIPFGQAWDLSLLVLIQKSCSIPDQIEN